jgi:flagellar P-ring protein FlgI
MQMDIQRQSLRQRTRRGPVRAWDALAVLAALAVAVVALAPLARAAKVKDLAEIQGVRSNPLIGYGIVVGLAGTGDSSSSLFANRSLAGLLAKLGIVVSPNELKVTNVAAVMVTATLPPYARAGEALDVTVSSIGDSKSLQGATLLASPLLGVDGQVYGLAQGPVTIGGFALAGGGDSVQQNHTTVGRIPRGAIVERELGFELGEREHVNLILRQKDFTTAARMAAAVNKKIAMPVAHATDAGTVLVQIPPDARKDPVTFLARIEEIEVVPGGRAAVVVNERTGTVVMGADVQIQPVAVAHGNLSITVSTRTEVSQPQPFSETGTTVVFDNEQIVVQEEGSNLILVQGATIGELVRSLNAIGVTPRDLIAILQAIQAAGALQGELRII